MEIHFLCVQIFLSKFSLDTFSERRAALSF